MKTRETELREAARRLETDPEVYARAVRKAEYLSRGFALLALAIRVGLFVGGAWLFLRGPGLGPGLAPHWRWAGVLPALIGAVVNGLSAAGVAWVERILAGLKAFKQEQSIRAVADADPRSGRFELEAELVGLTMVIAEIARRFLALCAVLELLQLLPPGGPARMTRETFSGVLAAVLIWQLLSRAIRWAFSA